MELRADRPANMATTRPGGWKGNTLAVVNHSVPLMAALSYGP